MNPEDRDLLRSYENGPRIWDAAAILPAVHRLYGQGLIEPAPPAEDGSARSTYCYQLTDAGREALRQEDLPQYTGAELAAIRAELDAAGIERAGDGSFTLPEREEQA
jgi:DNA-binding PadR family transcriptional regulator